MKKGKPQLSETERELFGIAGEKGYVRTFTKPTKRHIPDVEPSGAIKVESPATNSPVISGVASPTSMEVVEPVDVLPTENPSQAWRRSGTIRFLSGDNLHGFITMPGSDRDVYFSHKCCFGLMRALRIGDEVTFYIEEGAKGLWAHHVERTRN